MADQWELKKQWRQSDQHIVAEFVDLKEVDSELEELVKTPRSREAVERFVELRDAINIVTSLPEQYIQGLSNGGAENSVFLDIFTQVQGIQENVDQVYLMLDNSLVSFVNALGESYKQAKLGLSGDTFDRSKANMQMDEIALTYDKLSKSFGFYSDAENKKFKNWRLNRRAKKALANGTYKWNYVEELRKVSTAVAETWNCNRPKTKIFYKARSLPDTTGRMTKVDVSNFIIPDDGYVQQDLKDNHHHKNPLIVTDPNKCNDEIMNIYRFTRTRFEYEHDEAITGKAEYWLMPYELRDIGKGDCDDWANELASYLIGAGVPNFRVRVVCGRVNAARGLDDGGHSTVYVLEDDLKTWHHLNSTTSFDQIPERKLHLMPTSKHRSDGMGIGDVWFSYNNKYAWHSFDSDNARQSYMHDKRSKIIDGI
ncbi:hypothetical protein HN695_07955 [Candidatus Woesearchaeota archaeon]|jgi:predicted transglutaminase-like cysteine proteinase|nr:hypothetical protein [Candidatus Woesearchaeota archaeon]MBT5272475.1 hypothetical protein [Candidatus Woesearchaeota archaeon]MBT6041517.1 hypothetical protein [Candidatus Woesearchaeota archaeon]MBT6336337.1 hypothetical protein [Candidatus Woesearchaeota archaeon]MBT7928239.1 hypothetical protein [Candidatus Woesearchaeota archaeon]